MRSRSILWVVVLVVAILVTPGCALGPNFKTPTAPGIQTYTAQPLPERTVATDAPGGSAQVFLDSRDLPSRWWTLFGSPKLDALVAQALAANPSLASAQASLRQAGENFRAQRAGLFPSLDANASATRQKTDSSSFVGFGGGSGSGNGGNGNSGGSGGGGTIYNLYNASVDVSYTLDLFGGIRRGIESQAALFEYQRFQTEGVYQTLIANVVTSAVTEARVRRLIEGQDRIVTDLERQLKIVRARFDAGAVGRADVLNAQSSLATEQSTRVALDLQLAQAQNQLAVYLGQLPSERISSDFQLAELTLPQEIPLSLPSELVRQRPDVRAAEAQLHSASAQVGVATANLFPQLTLTGSLGTQSTTIGDLFKNGIWSVAASLAQPIFRGGALSAQRRAAIAAYDKSTADYRLTVLQAFQNVADVLHQIDADARTLGAQAVAVDAAEKSLRLSEMQYKLGALSLTDLLTVEQRFITANTNFVTAQAARYSDTAALFQALGGGWWTREQNSSAPDPLLGAASKQPIFPR